MLTFRRVVLPTSENLYHYLVTDPKIALQPMQMLIRNGIETPNVELNALPRPLGFADLKRMLVLSGIRLRAALNATENCAQHTVAIHAR
jgi:hypothetical protein